MARWSRLLLLAGVMICCVSCDQLTKSLAHRELAGRPPRSFLASTVRLVYAENPGGFLSLGARLAPRVRSVFFISFTALVVLAMLWVAVRGASLHWLQVAALGLVAAGGVGNLLDRLALGTVRDFMNLGIGPVRTGIFNVADVAVTAGILLLFAFSLVGRPEAPRPA